MVASAIDLTYLTIAEAARLYRARSLSPVDLTLAQLNRAKTLQPSLRAFISITEEIALAEARAAEAALLSGAAASPLLGVPLAYKDLYMTAGVLTTAGSMVHETWIPEITATTVQKLHDAGAIMLGKLSTHEFASGLTPEDHRFPPARNPWNAAHIPGGSSSGSGAALAAGIALGTLGTDTGGSIRGPGAYCGIAALKPTYGRCSRYGVVSLSWSLDHAGPMARSVEDVALLLNAMAGYDPKDPASARVPVDDYVAGLAGGVEGLRVGVLRSWYAESAKPEVLAAVDAAVDQLRELGAEVCEVTIPSIDLVKIISAILLPEAYAYHQPDLQETPELYADQLRNRLLAGGLYLAHEYVNAQRARQILKRDVATVLKDVDLLVSPTMPNTAPTFPEAYGQAMRRGPNYTALYNMTGLPAISIPCGFSAAGLPVGLMIAGRPFAEATVLRAAHAYEQATPWHDMHPAL